MHTIKVTRFLQLSTVFFLYVIIDGLYRNVPVSVMAPSIEQTRELSLFVLVQITILLALVLVILPVGFFLERRVL